MNSPCTHWVIDPSPPVYQPCLPHPSLQSQRRDLGRPAVHEPQNHGEGGETGDKDDNEGSEGGDGEEAVLNHLEKLPEDEQYIKIGKMFVLGTWPWASLDWWIGAEDMIEEPSVRATLDP